MSLTTLQKANYDRDGFLIYGPLLDSDDLKILDAQIDAFASGEHASADEIGIRMEEAARTGALTD